MATLKNKKNKVDQAFELLNKASRKDVKLSISLRLDADLYDELKRRANLGEGKGQYQTLLNDELRKQLFSDNKEEAPPFPFVEFDKNRKAKLDIEHFVEALQKYTDGEFSKSLKRKPRLKVAEKKGSFSTKKK